jgi:hypothetical protein
MERAYLHGNFHVPMAHFCAFPMEGLAARWPFHKKILIAVDLSLEYVLVVLALGQPH